MERAIPKEGARYKALIRGQNRVSSTYATLNAPGVNAFGCTRIMRNGARQYVAEASTRSSCPGVCPSSTAVYVLVSESRFPKLNSLGERDQRDAVEAEFVPSVAYDEPLPQLRVPDSWTSK